MEKVVYESQEITNWFDYILLKFADTNYFEIVNKEQEDYIVINSMTNKTKIWFYGLGETGLILADCQYTNDKCIGNSGETCGLDPNIYGTFTQHNVKTIDEQLDTPIYNGWLSIDCYLGNIFYKSVSYPDKDRTKTPYTIMGKFGCLTVLLFPVFFIFDYFLRKGIVGTKNEIIIEPIIDARNAN